MNQVTREAFEHALLRSVLAATAEQAEALRNQAQGMLAALLSERIISPLGHAAGVSKIAMARTERAAMKGVGK